MREIKFRQPLFVSEKFYKFHYWGFIDYKFIGPDCSWTSENKSQQYTGLKDKNGKEIYEGDIVKSKQTGNIFIIEYIYGMFECVKDKYSHCSLGALAHPQYGDGCEIIGNIYENPDLLEAK